MSAVMQDDPKLPGSLYAPKVSQAGKKELADCLTSDLEHIRVNIEPETPGKDGLAPRSWHENAEAHRHMHANQSSVARAEVRIKAIRTELDRREKAENAEAKAKKDEAKARLEAILADAPDHAKVLNEQAVQDMEAVERVRQFVSDVRTMARACRLPDVHRKLTSGAEIAAQSLKAEKPKLAGLPEDLPSKSEFDEALALMMGRHGGFDVGVEALQGAQFAKASTFARDLNRSGR